MALFKFTDKIIKGQAIPVYNNGKMMRDFTYVDDIVEGIIRVIDLLPEANQESDPSPATSTAPYRIYNIWNQQPVELKRYIEVLETLLGKKAQLELLPMQPGDIPNTYADVNHLEEAVGVLPHTAVEEGISRFVEWYQSYYGVSDTGQVIQHKEIT